MLQELKEQLDNGKNQMAKERAQGHESNPHGLAKEVNELIPAEIRKAQDQLGKINKSLGD